MIDPKHQRVLMFFVPSDQIKEALKDMQRSYEFGFSWVRSCDYIAAKDSFAVQVVMISGYPYLENKWSDQWERQA